MFEERPLVLAPEVRVVEASAGSGKTYALAKRYVQTLLNPRLPQHDIPLRNILAITFTNKAAFEMKKRILFFLKQMALGTLSSQEEQEILLPIGLTVREAQPQAVRVMDELIHNYNFFQVQTIDSFINALLSGCAFKIGLSAGFKIKRNFSEYLEYSLDRMIEQSVKDEVAYEILARFLFQYLFLENKTGWFPKKDMLELLKALYGQSNTYGRDFTAFDLQGDDLIVRKKKILGLMRKLREVLPVGTHATFLKSFDNFLSHYHDGFDFDEVSNYFSRETVPVTKGIEITKDLDRLWVQVQSQLIHLSEAEAYSLFNPYVEVFNWINKDFHEHAAKDDILFLPELNRRARELFDEGMVTVEELYYRLATRYHHYLLDEFQDTSRLQWQNLHLMVEEALSTGGTFFYVGDKKQAIYGFRGGEVKLFDEVKGDLGRFDVKTELLQTNYRSEKAIVDFNNKVFSAENLQRFIAELNEEEKDDGGLSPEDAREIENIFLSAHQTSIVGHDYGYVKVEVVDSKKRDHRNEEIRNRVLALLRDLKSRFDYRQIAILTRSNTEIEEVTSWLMAEGIFVESERTLNIKQNTLIQELVALLKFLESPTDNLSLAVFMSGDIFGKVSGITRQEMSQFLFDLRKLQTQEKDFFLYKAFQKAYPQVWEKLLAEFFKNVGLFPLYELISSILRRMKVIEHFPNEQGFVMRFLELIKEQEEEHIDLGTFLENFEALDNEDLFVNVVDPDAIRILTIHKAKGLEFPVVIIPFLGMKLHAASGGGLGQQSYILDFEDDNMKLLRIKKKYLKFSQKLNDIQKRERVRSFISELNNTYVALTRAGKEMYAFIPDKVGASRNLIRPLIPLDYYEVGTKVEYPLEAQHKKEGQLGLAPSGEHDWIEFLRDEFMDSESALNRQMALRGEILHSLLAGVGNLWGHDKSEVYARAFAQVQTRFPHRKDWQSIDKDFYRILNAPDLESFFVIPDGEVYTERELIDASGKTKRMDRLIIKENEIWVIDYKSTRDGRERYVKQVQEYMHILSDIHPGIKIKGFLIYLNDAGLEEIKL